MFSRFALVLLTVGMGLGSTACSSPPPKTPPEFAATLSAQVEPSLITRTVERHDNGVARVGRLSAARRINGIPCQDWVHFRADGSLRHCELSERSEVQGIRLPDATRIWFDARGRLESVWLRESIVLEGVPVRGGPGKIETQFHPNGRLRSVFLSESTVIQGVPCRATLLSPVRFHENGRLAGCQLSAKTKIRGRTFEADTQVWIDPEGNAQIDN